MKNRISVCLITALVSFRAHAQIYGQWTWMSGDNTPSTAPVYGTQGVANSANKPGNRDSQSGFVDPSGNFWLFGGDDVNAKTYNDLWKYNTSTGLWTWVSGANTTNSAGSYGTKGTASSSNQPQARFGQAITVDPSGDFWLFGGANLANLGTAAMLNDIWKYNPTSNQWTWMGGDNTTGSSGVYGTQGTAAAANKPGGRIYPSLWSDASGNIWIFGGLGFDNAGTENNLNDLWKFNPGTGQFTWVSGSNTVNATGNYGTKGSGSTSNAPPARNAASGWRDGSGNFWIFGGATGAFFSGGASYNDLWKYSTASGKWTWIGGDNTTGAAGVYGTKGTAATANKPGARYAQSVSVDAQDNFWLFGGMDGGTGALYNDLWVYNSSSNKWAWVGGSSGFNQASVYGAKGVTSASVTPSGRGFQSMWVDASAQIWVSSGYDGNDENDLFKWMIVTPLAVRDLNLTGQHAPSGNTLSWTALGETNVARYSIERSPTTGTQFTPVGALPAVGSGDNSYTFNDDQPPTGNVLYRIKAIARDSSSVYSNIISLSSPAASTINVYPNPTRGPVTIELQGQGSLPNTPLKIYTIDGRLVGRTLLANSTQTLDLGPLPAGIYFLHLADGRTFRIARTL
jgi:N-acetylneuraminic acid mutarotase